MKNFTLILCAPLIGLIYALTLPIAGFGLLAVAGARTLLPRTATA
jgi:hypothetical protein